MKILVLVEGPTDAAIVEVISKKVRCNVSTYIMRGNRLRKIRRILHVYQHVDRIIVLKDLHRYSEDTLTDIMRKIERMDNRITCIIVKRAIESWILADPSCLERKYKIKVEIHNPEELEDPAEELDRILRRIGRRYIKNYKFAKSLAECIDISNAATRSKSLARFIKALKSKI